MAEIPTTHWLRNEWAQQVANYATYFRRRVENPSFQATPGDRLIGRYTATNTQWEAWLQPYMTPFGDKSTIALDIGANIGTHTRHLADLFGSVYAFEPSSNTREILAANMEGYSNVIIRGEAIGDTTGTARLAVETRNRGASHITDKESGELVDLIRLDDLTFPARVSFMKVDVEGFEKQVFRGATDLIASDRPVIAYEDYEDTTKLIKSFGYRTHRVGWSDYIGIPQC